MATKYEQDKRLADIHTEARRELIMQAFSGLRALKTLPPHVQAQVRKWAKSDAIDAVQLNGMLADYSTALMRAYGACSAAAARIANASDSYESGRLPLHNEPIPGGRSYAARTDMGR